MHTRHLVDRGEPSEIQRIQLKLDDKKFKLKKRETIIFSF